MKRTLLTIFLLHYVSSGFAEPIQSCISRNNCEAQLLQQQAIHAVRSAELDEAVPTRTSTWQETAAESVAQQESNIFVAEHLNNTSDAIVGVWMLRNFTRRPNELNIEPWPSAYLWAKAFVFERKPLLEAQVALARNVPRWLVQQLAAAFHVYTGGSGVVFAFLPSSNGERGISFDESLGAFLMGDSDLGPDPDAEVTRQRLLALMEIVDVFVTHDDQDAAYAVGVETATLLVCVGGPDESCTSDPAGPVNLGVSPELALRVPLLSFNLSTASTVSTLAEVLRGCIDTPRPDITFQSLVGERTGYSVSAEEIAVALHNEGLSVEYVFVRETPLDGWATRVQNRAAVRLVRPRRDGPCGRVYLGYYVPLNERRVDRCIRKARMAVLITTWETTRVPTGFAEKAGQFDKLLVTCQVVAEAYQRARVAVPIEVVSLGVNVELWPLLERKPERVFRFAMFADGNWDHHRKNYHIAYEAFMELFGGNFSVELLVKVNSPTHKNTSIISVAPKNVKFYTGRLEQALLLDMLKRAHCFLFPSRGEGFGLPVREAMATGIPGIFAGFAGLSNIADPEISYPLLWNFSRATGYEETADHFDGVKEFGWWANVDKASLKAAMVDAVENPRECARRGLNAALWIQRYQTYRRTAREILRAFKPHVNLQVNSQPQGSDN